MRIPLVITLALCCAIHESRSQRATAASPAPARSGPGIIHVRMETSLGAIDIDVDSAHAPVTATNFLRYVDGHFYDGGQFTRTVRLDNQPNDSIRIQVIQGIIATSSLSFIFPEIPLEPTNRTGLKHLDGTISMARSANPNSANFNFFICIGNQPELDFGGRRNPDRQGFAAFGRVTHGMDVVRAIQAGHATGQTLSPPIQITRTYRVSAGK